MATLNNNNHGDFFMFNLNTSYRYLIISTAHNPCISGYLLPSPEICVCIQLQFPPYFLESWIHTWQWVIQFIFDVSNRFFSAPKRHITIDKLSAMIYILWMHLRRQTHFLCHCRPGLTCRSVCFTINACTCMCVYKYLHIHCMFSVYLLYIYIYMNRYYVLCIHCISIVQLIILYFCICIVYTDFVYK